MAKEIELTQGFVALVDDIDFEYLSQFNWCVSHGYAVRRGENNRHLGMHRVILERKLGRKLVKGEIPEHKNHQRSDNTRDNIRLATQGQNIANIPKYASKKSSRFKGVSFQKSTGKWNAQIKVNGKLLHIGTFSVEEDAGRAYDKRAYLHFGEFASLNFPG